MQRATRRMERDRVMTDDDQSDWVASAGPIVLSMGLELSERYSAPA